MRKLCYSVLILGLLVPILPLRKTTASGNASHQLFISQIKLGGDKAPKEFVQLFNPTSQTISLSGWKLEYAKPTYSKSNCEVDSWASLSVNGSASSTYLKGEILPGAVSTPIERPMTNDTSGSLRISNSENVVSDLVGWGEDAPCFESQAAPIPSNEKSLARYLDCGERLPIDTDDNSSDFDISPFVNTSDLIEIYKSSCQSPNDELPESGSGVENGSKCDGLMISEILPNPSGSDVGHEFIEVYNPTVKVVSLENCQLQTSGGNQKYKFGSEEIAPSGRKAFYDSATNLALPNSSGGTVWLINESDVEVDEVKYPEDLEDDVSWNKIDNNWEISYTPTPSTTNVQQQTKPCPSGQVRSIESNRCVSSAVVTSSLVPCAPGKERNTLTNRCRNSVNVLAVVKACASDQFRNPLTNRCKKTEVSSIAPCKSDQFRNPETNRCKKLVAMSRLKPCKEGQERNPETNRCRNIAAVGTSGFSKITDIAAPLVKNSASWWLAGATVIGAVGYALFEWRREIATSFIGFKSKFATSSE